MTARSTSCTRSRPSSPRRATCSGWPPTASRSPARSSASRSTASSSTPRSRAPMACGCSRTSPASVPRSARLPEMAIELYPAVDVLGGKAVRLQQGDFARSTTYDADPFEAAGRWVDQGARRLHVVDLDGARSGVPVNLDALERIARLGVPVQYG